MISANPRALFNRRALYYPLYNSSGSYAQQPSFPLIEGSVLRPAALSPLPFP